jgi:nitrate reductase NapE component
MKSMEKRVQSGTEFLIAVILWPIIGFNTVMEFFKWVA